VVWASVLAAWQEQQGQGDCLVVDAGGVSANICTVWEAQKHEPPIEFALRHQLAHTLALNHCDPRDTRRRPGLDPFDLEIVAFLHPVGHQLLFRRENKKQNEGNCSTQECVCIRWAWRW
jgi:hypothetical protein